MPSDGHNGAADLGRLGAVYRRRNYADRGPLFTQLLERECGVRYQQPLVADSMLRYLCSTDEATFHMYSAAAGTPVPPFTISFSTVVCDGHLLAVGDEEGYVSLLDTSVPVEYDHWGRLLPRPGGHSFWQAHRNAIMAIAWAERDTKLLVASADQTVTEWDVESRRLVCTMQGHRGTVTCLATNPTQPTECVSGGRDGALLFWDRRQSGGSCGSGRRRGGPVIANLQAAGGSEASTVTSLAAYRTIANLHVSKEQRESYTAGQRPRRRRSTLTAGSTSSIPADDYISKTVTAVLYTHDEHQLVSAGAADGVIKFWDFRVWRSSLDSAPSRLSASSSPCHDPARPLLGVAQQPVSIGAAGRRIRHSSGISSLALDPSRTMLMASSCDGHLCQYSAIHPAAVKPVLYTGHVNSNASGTFIKCAFSPDGRYVASGSADGCGYIWAVSHTADRNEGSMGSPQWCLPGHSDECTSVTWAGLAAGRVCLPSVAPFNCSSGHSQ